MGVTRSKVAVAGIALAIVALPAVAHAESTHEQPVAMLTNLAGSAVLMTETAYRSLSPGDVVMAGEELRFGEGSIGELSFFEGGVVLSQDACRLTMGDGASSFVLEEGALTLLTFDELPVAFEIDGELVSVLPDSFIEATKRRVGRREVTVLHGLVYVEADGIPIILGPQAMAWSLSAGRPWHVIEDALAVKARAGLGTTRLHMGMVVDLYQRGIPFWCNGVVPAWTSGWASEAWAYCASLLGECYCSYLYDPRRNPAYPDAEGTQESPICDAEDDDAPGSKPSNPGDEPVVDDSQNPSDRTRDVGPGEFGIVTSDGSNPWPFATRSFSPASTPERDYSWLRSSSSRSSSSTSAAPAYSSSSRSSSSTSSSTSKRRRSSSKKKD